MTTHRFLTLDKKIELVKDSADGAGLSQRKLYKLVGNLESTLIDIYMDSKANKQTSITDFFRRT
jgi:hypothetical protein